MYFKIEICHIVVGIEHREEYIASLCRDYLAGETDEEAFSVRVSDEDIAYEKTLVPDRFSEGMYEATAIHRKLTGELAKRGIILIHSAVAAVDGQGYAFLARSGVGKSTHIRQWMKELDAIVVNGDKPYYAFEQDKLMVYGSPWRGKEGWGINASFPMKAFCFLDRGNENRIRRAEKSEIFRRLFDQVLVPRDGVGAARFMKVMDQLMRSVPFYILECTISPEAARVAYEGMVDSEVCYEEKK